MIISVASGKGGTGKTTIAVNLALSLNENVQFLDCDVEEPNAHIFLKPKITRRLSFGTPVPEVDEKRCNHCGKCQEVCAHNAIVLIKDKVLIFPEICHGCGGCALLCPKHAIEEVIKEVGIIQFGNAGAIEFVNGKVNVGQDTPAPLIRQVKKHINRTKTVIIDAPPGTSCPVVESIKGSDYCILVTEPTPFGLNDLVLAIEVMRKLKIPFGVVINRSDIGDGKVEEYCQAEDIPILMKIPFNRDIAVNYSKGIPIVDAFPAFKTHYREILNKIKNHIEKDFQNENKICNILK